MPYFSGKGKLFIATVANGVPGAFRFVGNVAELNVQLSTEIAEHTERQSGQNLTDARLNKKKSSKFMAKLEEFSKENLALALYGASSTIAGGSVTNEAMPSGLVAGDFYKTAKAKISSVVVKDSAGTPATLVLNTDYRIESADHGMIEILNVGSYTQPFKADYANASVTSVNMFTQAMPTLWLRFNGLNTADSDKPLIIDLYKAQPDPLKQLDLIVDDYGSFSLEGSALYDSTKANDSVLGPFGRVQLL